MRVGCVCGDAEWPEWSNGPPPLRMLNTLQMGDGRQQTRAGNRGGEIERDRVDNEEGNANAIEESAR